MPGLPEPELSITDQHSLFCPRSWKTAYHPIPCWGLSRSSCAICCWPGGEGECQRGKTLGICIATPHDWSESTTPPPSDFYIRWVQSAPIGPEISAILPASSFYQFYCFLHWQSHMAFWTPKVASAWDRQALHWWMEFLLKIEDMNLVFAIDFALPVWPRSLLKASKTHFG